MADESGVPSTPTVETDRDGSAVLADLTPTQRGKWRETGEIPERKADQSADAAAAEPVEQATSTDVQPKAAPEAAKPHKNAETRKAELDADIQGRLQRRRELDAEIAERETRLTRPATSAAPRPATGPADADPEPNPDDATKYPDGQFDRKYLKDLGAWSGRQEYRSLRAAELRHEADARAEQALGTRVGTFKSRMDAAAKADPALMDSLSPEVKAIHPLSLMTPEDRERSGNALNALADEWLQLEHPDVALRYFSEHPEELRRFERLDPRSFLLAWGKLQATFEAPPASPDSPRLTNAPAPPTTLGRRAAEPADEVDGAVQRGDQRAYKEAMNRREAARFQTGAR